MGYHTDGIQVEVGDIVTYSSSGNQEVERGYIET